MNNNAEVLPIAYEVDEEKVNNDTIATIYVNYEPNIEPFQLVETNHIPLRRTTNQYYNTQIFDTKFKVLFIKHLIQVIIAILIFILLFYVVFGYIN
ncbi:MAG: hypothetical protein CMJ38_00465 [Phycisphaerae bacterium]|nr:hypothetical protein [Phycisphaerae bacterium]|tara:strand:+ start:664 stop:951 length:288 start_codon:yes stop_codon:yes gene_type:complete